MTAYRNRLTAIGRKTAGTLLFAIAILQPGCGQTSTTPETKTNPTGTASSEKTPGYIAKNPSEPAAEKVALEVVKFQQLKDVLAAQKGKIVVVDVWAEY